MCQGNFEGPFSTVSTVIQLILFDCFYPSKIDRKHHTCVVTRSQLDKLCLFVHSSSDVRETTRRSRSFLKQAKEINVFANENNVYIDLKRKRTIGLSRKI